MNLEGRKVVVNKSVNELVEMLNKPEDYKNLMPESLQSFEVRDNGFKFSLKGMPEIALTIDEVSDKQIVLKSASSSLVWRSSLRLSISRRAITIGVSANQFPVLADSNLSFVIMSKGR